jgi:hypothetical protein
MKIAIENLEQPPILKKNRGKEHFAKVLMEKIEATGIT